MLENDQQKKYDIPVSFRYDPFFKNRKTFLDYSRLNISETIDQEPFYYDMLVHQSQQEKPWESPNKYVPLLFEKWKQRVPEINNAFAKRKINAETNELMIHCISLFIISLYWSNNSPVKSLNIEDANILKNIIKPINVEERLLFIIKNYTKFHSFSQLKQLFIEHEKAFYKKAAIDKLKKR